MMSVFGRLAGFLRTPSRRWSAGALLAGGTLFGVLLWGGFNWSLELTNTEKFCISCHEMEENVFKEYRDTIHYNNRSGVRATCPDCHVPREWQYKVLRKIRASNELYHKIMGSVSTAEKFEAKRLELARHVWQQMKDTDSRECRNCHEARSMDYMKQQQRAAHRHEKGFEEGKTCIDCHKGIAHSLPTLYEEDPSAALGRPRLPQ